MEISEREKRAIETYRGIGYRLINNILEIDMGAEGDFILHSTDKPETFDRSSIERMIENIKLIYSAMLKYSNSNSKAPTHVFRGTSVPDMERIQKRGVANKFLSTTLDVETQAKGYFSLSFNQPAFTQIDVPDNIPYLYMGDILELGQNPEKEYLLSPFLKISEFEYVKSETRSTISGPKTQKGYRMKVERQELTELAEEERDALTADVLDNAEDISQKQERYFKVLEDILDNEWKIKRNKEKIYDIRNTLYRGDISEKERRWLEDDFSFLANENAKTLENEHSKLLQEKAELAQVIEGWKRNVAKICMSECRTQEKEFEQQLEEERKAEEQRVVKEKREREERANRERINNKRNENNRITQLHEMACDMVQTKVKNTDRAAKELIAFKETLASIADEMGISYTSRLDVIRHLPQCIKGLNDRLNIFSSLEEGREVETEEEIDAAISSRQGLKNASNRILRECDAIKSIKVDELKDLEENTFKGGIANSVLDIKLDIFTNVLQSEISRLDNKRGLKKFLDTITGRKRKDEQRKMELGQAIHTIQNKKRTLTINNNLNAQYSIHEIMADIEGLKNQYGRETKLKEDFERLEKLEAGIKKTYRVKEDRVRMLMARNEQSRLPAVKGKTYTVSDLILFQVNALSNPSAPDAKGERQGFGGAKECPPALANCMHLETSMQIMSNIMRDVLEARGRSKEVNMER